MATFPRCHGLLTLSLSVSVTFSLKLTLKESPCVEFHGLPLPFSWIRLPFFVGFCVFFFVCGFTRGGLWLCHVSRMMVLLRQRALLLVLLPGLRILRKLVSRVVYKINSRSLRNTRPRPSVIDNTLVTWHSKLTINFFIYYYLSITNLRVSNLIRRMSDRIIKIFFYL
jgi:hypothetical protein